VFRLALEEGLKVVAHKFSNGKYFDMGSYEGLLKLQIYLAKKNVA